MKIVLVASLMGLLGLARDCGEEEPANGGGNGGGGTTQPTPRDTSTPLWEQVFGEWSCEAAGRAPFAFEVVRKSEYGQKHDWVDAETGQPLEASVTFTSIYLLTAAGKAFRNFEYKTVEPEVMDHLEEWSLTANGETPYRCLPK